MKVNLSENAIIGIVVGTVVAAVGSYRLPLPASEGIGVFIGATLAILAALLGHSHD